MNNWGYPSSAWDKPLALLFFLIFIGTLIGRWTGVLQ